MSWMESYKTSWKKFSKDVLNGVFQHELKGVLQDELNGVFRDEIEVVFQNELKGIFQDELKGFYQYELKGVFQGELKRAFWIVVTNSNFAGVVVSIDDLNRNTRIEVPCKISPCGVNLKQFHVCFGVRSNPSKFEVQFSFRVCR